MGTPLDQGRFVERCQQRRKRGMSGVVDDRNSKLLGLRKLKGGGGSEVVVVAGGYPGSHLGARGLGGWV